MHILSSAACVAARRSLGHMRANRWSVKLHHMSGIPLGPWARFLWRHGRQIHWRTYWHRVLFLSFMSVVNTLLALPDWLLYRRLVQAQTLNPEPVIILGHPRTGTTHLHNLLSLDPAFAFCTTFHAGFPCSFISMSPLRGVLSWLLEERRPMDNMALHWDLPAEDEIATNVLTGGTSPYCAIVLPCDERKASRPYFTFEPETDVCGSLTGDQLRSRFKEWRGGFLTFMKKVTLWHSFQDAATSSGAPPGRASSSSSSPASTLTPPKPLLIKSPVHTARIPLFLDMFPRARLVYIHRHPLEVFQSAAHMADTYYWYTYLQTPTNRQVTDFILDQYDFLYERYTRDRARLPPSQLHELSFESLEADPIDALRRIYAQFGWLERFESLLPRFRAYCATLSDFKRNHLNRLSPELAAEVRRRWQPSFREFGYT